MEILPYDVKHYEILPLLDTVSTMVLQHTQLGKPYPKELNDDDQTIIISYGLKYTQYFYDLNLLNKNKICRYAAWNGHLEVLKWARENGCPWNELICTNAALNGHLEVLKWTRENGCNWNDWTCANAAKNGHLEVLKWARENGCPEQKK